MSDERQLLEAARAGDEKAFALLVGPYLAQLRAHCYRMLGSLTDAEDALQETMLRAWGGLARFETRSSLSVRTKPSTRRRLPRWSSRSSPTTGLAAGAS